MSEQTKDGRDLAKGDTTITATITDATTTTEIKTQRTYYKQKRKMNWRSTAVTKNQTPKKTKQWDTITNDRDERELNNVKEEKWSPNELVTNRRLGAQPLERNCKWSSVTSTFYLNEWSITLFALSNITNFLPLNCKLISTRSGRG